MLNFVKCPWNLDLRTFTGKLSDIDGKPKWFCNHYLLRENKTSRKIGFGYVLSIYTRFPIYFIYLSFGIT